MQSFAANTPETFAWRTVAFRQGLRDLQWVVPEDESLGVVHAILDPSSRSTLTEGHLGQALRACLENRQFKALPALLPLLSTKEASKVANMSAANWSLINYPELVPMVLPVLLHSSVESLFHQALAKSHDHLFEAMEPYLKPSFFTEDRLMTAASQNLPNFGHCMMAHLDVFALIKKKAGFLGREQLAVWLAQAVIEGSQPVPDLGKRPGVWSKKFPELVLAVRTKQREASLEQALPLPSPSVRVRF